MSPFVILLGTIAIEGISRRSRLVKSVALVTLIFVSCFSVARFNMQEPTLYSRLPVRYVIKEIRRGVLMWDFGIGTGQHIPTCDEQYVGYRESVLSLLYALFQKGNGTADE